MEIKQFFPIYDHKETIEEFLNRLLVSRSPWKMSLGKGQISFYDYSIEKYIFVPANKIICFFIGRYPGSILLDSIYLRFQDRNKNGTVIPKEQYLMSLDDFRNDIDELVNRLNSFHQQCFLQQCLIENLLNENEKVDIDRIVYITNAFHEECKNLKSHQ